MPAAAPPTDPTLVLPEPQSLKTVGEPFDLLPTTPVLHAPECAEAASQLASRLTDGLGWHGTVSRLDVPDAGVPDAPAVRLTVDTDLGRVHGPEAHRVVVGASGVELVGASPVGVLHAVRTLLQLLPARVLAADGASWWPTPEDTTPLARVAGVRIEDHPRFAYRGLMLDVVRSFLTVEEVRAIVEAAGLAKINVLHLHLVDDQGWRLEITNEGRVEGDTIDYTALTRVSGATAVTEPGYDGRPGRTGFYTQDDYRRLVDFCRSRGIEVVPEIEVPGHAGAALHTVPELCTPGSSHTATPEAPTAPADGSVEVGRSYLDPHAPAVRTFLTHVLSQVVALDPHGRHVHIGGDEPWAMAERYGITEGSPYAEIVGFAMETVRGLGREPIAWNEAVSGAREGTVLQLWDPERTDLEELSAAARRGVRLLMSPGAHAYLDQKYDPSSPVGLTWAGVVDVPAARDWDPVAILKGLGEDDVLGVEAPLWSETVRSRADAEWLVFPRLLAVAEVGWSAARGADDAAEPEAFLRRCAAYGPRLAASGTTFHRSRSVPWARD